MATIHHKILILDDSELIRDLVKETLEERGYSVIAISSPIGFSNLLRKEKPDLALVDVMMPGLKGDKLAEIAIERGAPCPIVLFSDRPAAELAKAAKASGVAGYICKTADMDALVRSVAQYLTKPAG